MMAEPLVHKVLSMATSSSFSKKAGATSGDGGGRVVGILSFEAANAMSRTADLHRSLSDAEAARLLGPLCLGSRAVRSLVPGDDARLLTLALAEKLDALNRVAAVAACLGRRCAAPALQGFDHVYADLLAGRCSAAEAAPFAPASSSDSALVRQLDRLATATAGLYAELDALADLEQSARKLPTDEARRALEQHGSCPPRPPPTPRPRACTGAAPAAWSSFASHLRSPPSLPPLPPTPSSAPCPASSSTVSGQSPRSQQQQPAPVRRRSRRLSAAAPLTASRCSLLVPRAVAASTDRASPEVLGRPPSPGMRPGW